MLRGFVFHFRVIFVVSATTNHRQKAGEQLPIYMLRQRTLKATGQPRGRQLFTIEEPFEPGFHERKTGDNCKSSYSGEYVRRGPSNQR